MGSVMTNIFGFQGAGFVLFQIVAVACVGWLLSYAVQFAGWGNISGLIRGATLFIILGLVTGTVFKFLGVVAKTLGITG